MQSYHVSLSSPVFDTFRCVRAADSMDIDVTQKSKHELTVKADVMADFNVGLIVGSSGSGKTTLAEVIFGEDAVWRHQLDPDKALIDQFPEVMSYEDCVHALTGVGLSQVPCWIRPAHTLSTGQRARAAAALSMCDQRDMIVLDEWTSVVDRSIGKIMSHCVQKFARRNSKRIVFLSCHYDVVEWLDPDWIIDCNTATFEDRRSLQRGQRSERIAFDVRTVSKDTWRHFKKYHYLSDRLPPVKLPAYGLFHGDDQVGFCSFTNYVPHRQGDRLILHCSRCVLHPDYCGLALGGKLLNIASGFAQGLHDCRIMAKGSNEAMYAMMIHDPVWQLKEVKRQMGKMTIGAYMARRGGFRLNVRTYSWEYIGPSLTEEHNEEDRNVAGAGLDGQHGMDDQGLQHQRSKVGAVQVDGTGG